METLADRSLLVLPAVIPIRGDCPSRAVSVLDPLRDLLVSVDFLLFVFFKEPDWRFL